MEILRNAALDNLLLKALHQETLDFEEILALYQIAPLHELVFAANHLRFQHHPQPKVTWIIDRNVNITNICFSGCEFCNFYKGIQDADAYITTIDEYNIKIKELYRSGGRQLLLQGGLHPKLGLQFYVDLFKKLKNLWPDLKLHALGPPEIVHLSRLEQTSYLETLQNLMNAGMDSLPGAGAEILSDRVRGIISKNKCNTQQWLDVMTVAHQLGLITSATMMFGHIETIEERIQHLILIRDLQSHKPAGSPGFIAFIPWPFQQQGTVLAQKYQIQPITPLDYVRFIALSRIVLHNINNIQVSWLTVGSNVAQLCLHAGANDMGSIMIEENVVSAAGATHQLNAAQMVQTIQDAGFIPQLRNQKYEEMAMPKIWND